LSFAPFSRAAFSSLVTIPNLNFAQFSRAAFASLVTIPGLSFGAFFRAGFSSLANINALAYYPASQSRYGAWTRTFSSGWLPDLETPMSVVQVRQNTATTISVFMRDGATGLGLPGIAPASFVIKLKKSNQVAFSTITPVVTDTGLGWYDLAITATHANTTGKAPLEVAATGAMTRDDLMLDVITLNMFTDVVRAGLTALPADPFGNLDGLPSAEQVANIGVTGAALNANAASRTITTGTEVGTLAGASTLDGVFHTFTDVAGVIDFYYEFDVSATLNATGVSAQWKGYLNGIVNTIKVYAWNWISLAWDQVGMIPGSADTTVYGVEALLTNSHTGTGIARIRFQNTGLTTATFATDRILFGYTVTPSTPSNIANVLLDHPVGPHTLAGSVGLLLNSLPSAAQITTAILDALRSGHVVPGSIGEGIAIATGLLQGNFYMDNVTNTTNGQTAARMRVFHTGVAAAAATPGGIGEGEFATFLVATSYSGPGNIIDHRVVQQ
jgi:hypothetical protein